MASGAGGSSSVWKETLSDEGRKLTYARMSTTFSGRHPPKLSRPFLFFLFKDDGDTLYWGGSLWLLGSGDSWTWEARNPHNTAHLAFYCRTVELKSPFRTNSGHSDDRNLLVSQPLCATSFGSLLFPGDVRDRAVEIVH